MNPIRVGLIGASPDRGWAATAHIPALKALPDFELAAISTTKQESADAVAQKHGIPHAFADWQQMVCRPDVDLVIVTVKVAAHRDAVLGALAAGKHVFCEWPLARDTAEAEEMLAAAQRAGVQHMEGLQGRHHPVLNRVRDGYIGRLLSCTLVSSLATWGPRLAPADAYLADRAGGATGLTIPGGHSLDTLCACVGRFRDLAAVLSTQHPQAEIIGTGHAIPVTSPDQVLISGTLEGGAVVGIHIKADMAVPLGVRLEVNGSEGDLVLRSEIAPGGPSVGIQRAELVLTSARRNAPEWVTLDVPSRYSRVPTGVPRGAQFYTAQLLVRLAEAIRTGTKATPDFADAVACHRMLDLVQAASDTGHRVSIA